MDESRRSTEERLEEMELKLEKLTKNRSEYDTGLREEIRALANKTVTDRLAGLLGVEKAELHKALDSQYRRSQDESFSEEISKAIDRLEMHNREGWMDERKKVVDLLSQLGTKIENKFQGDMVMLEWEVEELRNRFSNTVSSTMLMDVMEPERVKIVEEISKMIDRREGSFTTREYLSSEMSGMEKRLLAKIKETCQCNEPTFERESCVNTKGCASPITAMVATKLSNRPVNGNENQPGCNKQRVDVKEKDSVNELAEARGRTPQESCYMKLEVKMREELRKEIHQLTSDLDKKVKDEAQRILNKIGGLILD